MEVWYYVSKWKNEIMAVEVVKETDKTLVLASTNYKGKNNRELKATQYSIYFKTKFEAVEYLFSRLNNKVISFALAHKRAERELKDFKAKYKEIS